MKNITRSLILLASLFIYASFTLRKSQNLTVITYNVWHGFESQDQRKDAFVKWAKQQNADVIAFQELNILPGFPFPNWQKVGGIPMQLFLKRRDTLWGYHPAIPLAMFIN